MPHNSSNDGCALLALLLAIGIPLVWICFLIWAIYSVVTWITSK